jgi:hypothetical protein
MNWLLSDKTKKNLDGLISEHGYDMTAPGRARRPGISRGGGSSAYSGPFAVAKLTDTSAEVLGYSATDGQYWNNYIISGLSRIEVADGASVTGITTNGYLYVGITWNGSAYVATLAHAAALPVQDNTHVYIPLAFILCADSKISSIVQIRHDIIEHPARAG